MPFADKEACKALGIDLTLYRKVSTPVQKAGFIKKAMVIQGLIPLEDLDAESGGLHKFSMTTFIIHTCAITPSLPCNKEICQTF